MPVAESAHVRAIVVTLPADLREEWDERAAILEYCAGHDRAEAERIALVMVRQRVQAAATGQQL